MARFSAQLARGQTMTAGISGPFLNQFNKEMLFRVDITDVESHVRLDISGDGEITVVDPSGYGADSIGLRLGARLGPLEGAVAYLLLTRWLRGYQGGRDAAKENGLQVIVRGHQDGSEYLRVGMW
jgi:hypothetical protein